MRSDAGEDGDIYCRRKYFIRMVQLAVGVNLLSILGAVLDTTLSVTSSMYEVMLHKPEITRAELFGSGIQIRKGYQHDQICSALLFAYLGESILLFSYVIKMSYSFKLALVQVSVPGHSGHAVQAITCPLAISLIICSCGLYIFTRKRQVEKN